MSRDRQTSQHYSALIKQAKKSFSKYNPEDVKEAIGKVLFSMLVKKLGSTIINDETYFMRSVKHQLLNICNRKNYLQEKERVTAFNFYGSDNPKVDIEELQEDEFIKFIEVSLKQLPKGQAAVIRLVLEGNTNPEIAVILGIKINNVKQRKYLATQTLREMARSGQDVFFNQQ